MITSIPHTVRVLHQYPHGTLTIPLLFQLRVGVFPQYPYFNSVCILYILDVSISLHYTLLMHIIHLRCMYLTVVYPRLLKHFLCIIIKFIIHFRCIYLTVVYPRLLKHFLCILYILDVSISHNV